MNYYPAWFPKIMNSLLGLIGLENGLPQGWLILLWALILFLLVTVVAKASVIFMVLMERKVLAWLTQRKGPNRVGPWGLLQTLADGVKLLFKEDIMTSEQDKLLFTLAPAIFFIPTFVFFAVIPFTDQLTGVALPAGLLFVFAISSISVIGMVLAGWASCNKYSLMGGMRSAAQAISYEIPLILAVLAVALFAGSMNLREIVEAQSGFLFSVPLFQGIQLGIPNWFVLTLTPITFLIFFIAAIAEVNRIPFDLPEAESELVSGYNTEYSGMKFALFFLAEYAALFAMCALMVTLFFGGYNCLFGGYLADTDLFRNSLAGFGFDRAMLEGLVGLHRQIEMLAWFLGKTYVFIFIAMWVRGTLPRLKPDQLMGFGWKFLIPLALLNIFVVSLEKYMVNGGQYSPTFAGMPAWMTAGIWLIIAAAVFYGFFEFSSRLLSKKLEARLANR